MNQQKITVLGIGNLLWADEGFGVRCVEALADYTFTPEIELVDGGTQGLYLLEYVQSSTHLIIMDAIDYGLPAGELKLIENDDVPKFLGAKKMSLHQTGFQEVLQISQLTGHYPEQLLLIGCQPQVLEDYGGSLTEVVKSVLPHAVEFALQRLSAWGVSHQKKLSDNAANHAANPTELAAYENQRPAADEACRIGDARFLNIRADGNHR